MKKTIIIGGVAGGASCAARLRRLDEEREIILLERGRYISYANCGLPYHVGNVIPSRDSLLVTRPEQMRARFRIDVRTENEAVRIDRDKKTVTILDKASGRTYEETYDDLVLATGSSPLRPRIPGIESKRVHTLWTVPDAEEIRRLAANDGVREAAVVGGGFIGLEIAENLKAAGLDVSVIEAADQVLPPLDPEMAKLIQENLIENGVHLYINDPVQSFEDVETEGRSMVRVQMKSGQSVTAELVVLSIGVRPNTQLAKEAGLALNERGAVITDPHMRTNDPDIYAVGDIAETVDIVTGARVVYQLAGPANKQGRVAADNIAGSDVAYRGSQGTSVAKVFDLTAGMTGQSEKALKRRGLEKGRDYKTAYVTQNQHAGYYPGAVPMTIKIIFAPDGSRIFGAQIVGRDGVDKRIDTIAAALRLNARATELADLEFAYAPPYSSAKDPVNMAGFTVRNIVGGLVKFCEWDELDRRDDLQLVDVREDAERLAFEIPGAAAIPLGQLRDRLDELDPAKPTVVFCAIGVRSYNGARILMQHGFGDVMVYPGGTRFYQSTHYEKFAVPGASGSGSNSGAASGGSGRQQSVLFGDDGMTVLSGNDGEKVDGNSNINGSADCTGARKMRVDCSGMQCPGPLMKVFQAMKELAPGEVMEVTASDPGFTKDIVAWCRRTGNELLSNERKGKEYVACIRKEGTDGAEMAASGESAPAGSAAASANGGTAAGAAGGSTGSAGVAAGPVAPGRTGGMVPRAGGQQDGKTLIVFSGDMDRVLASFIIANGAAAMGKPVTMFFTFWGLSVLRKPQKQNVQKSFTEKMFGAMLPRGTEKLKLSHMNMGGAGTSMMKKIMKEKNVDSLEELIRKAREAGVKLVACAMSMDVMGIKPEELIDGVEIGGVGYYLGDAEESNVNLFI